MDNINDNKELRKKRRFSGIVKVMGSFLGKRSYFCGRSPERDRRNNYADEKSKDGDSPKLEKPKTTQPVTDN